jgi:type VI secretion system protein ImpL
MLRSRATRWLIAAGVLLLFLVVLVALDRTLTLDPVSRWVLRLGLVLLGLVAAGAIIWYLRPVDEAPALDPGDDVQLVVRAARAALPRGSFAARPLVLVLGPEGGAKTTIVARSGGDPQLLAGDPSPGPTDRPTPTATANVWVMQQALVAELTSRILPDGVRFPTIIRALRAPRVAAAVGRGEASPRAAVVCVPCDLFYEGGQGEQLARLGAMLRQRLAEAARELGLALPVYVLFTKMDRIPHFEPWVSVFTRDELRAPFGATLRFDPQATTGNHAERLAPRLSAAFEELGAVVGARRVESLAREGQVERRYAAYEWPREFQKLQQAVTPFLLELCRPTQLGVSPQLRGFYFTGARPVLVSDVGTAAADARRAPSADATQLFASAAPPVGAAPVTRRVPEWVFLDRFLREVVLADRGAISMARGGVGVQRTRRLLLGTTIAVAALLLLAVTRAWLGNRAVQGRVAAAAGAVVTLPTVQSTNGQIVAPSPEALARLDGLRALLDTVQQLDNETPLGLRFGLWRGEALLDAARPVWLAGFRTQLLGDTWRTLADSLTALAAAGETGDYATHYARLKAYLIMTTRPDQSTVAFLAPVLQTTWRRGVLSDADLNALAERQFTYFAAMLPFLETTGQAGDARLVESARAALARSTGGDQVYANMLGAANRQVPPVKIPQSPTSITTVPEVAGSFSAKGATFMAEAFRNPDPYLQGEEWVVGQRTAARVVNRDSLIRELRGRYAVDYTRTWSQVVENARVLPPSRLPDAVMKLEELAGIQSPLLQLLRTVALNTTIDSTTAAAFQPVHAVTPPTVTDKYVSEANKPYIDGLTGLQGTLRQIATMPPAVDTPSTQALVMAAQLAGGTVMTARAGAMQVAQAFDVSSSGGAMARPVQALLLAPIAGAEGVLRQVASQRPPARRMVAAGGGGGGGAGGAAAEAASLNERGRAICSRIDPLTERFPFNPDATADANLADLKAILTPGTGELAVFVQERLMPYVDRQGKSYVAKTGGRVEVSKAFVDFLNRAAEVSDAFFTEDPTTPKISWAVIGEISDRTPLLILRNDGREARFDKKSFRNLVVWPATNGRDAQLQAQFKKNKPATVKASSGDWAMFHLALSADANDGQRMTWNVNAKDAEPVSMRFEAQRREAAAVLTRGWLGRMSCVPQVTK